MDRSFYIKFLERGLTELDDVVTIFFQHFNILDLIFSSNVGTVGNVEVIAPISHCLYSPVPLYVFLPGICEDQSGNLSNVKLWSTENYSNLCRELETLN